MYALSHENRFFGVRNVVFGFREPAIAKAIVRHMHNKDPSTYVYKRTSTEYNITLPTRPLSRGPLDKRRVKVVDIGKDFFFALSVSGCDIFVVDDMRQAPGKLVMVGEHFSLDEKVELWMCGRNLESLLKENRGLFKLL